MKFKKTMSVIIAAAMLTSTFCAMGSLSASADVTANSNAANSVDSLVVNDFATYPTYDGNDLGATYSAASTTFKVWAPSSSKVTLNLYNSGDIKDKEKISSTEMTLDKSTGVWSITVNGDMKNKYYTYTVVNDLNPNGKEVCDIYAKAAGVNGNRAMVVDLDSTDPEGWENDHFQRAEEATDASIWEVHIKDFSYDPESGVSEQYRGKYMAFTELETTLNNAGDIKTCMNYLKDLGIKYVQINPMYDFGSVDEAGGDSQFNFGYDPKNYNVPEGSYSTNPNDGNVRINEMKQMIKALHDNGIGVIMDVVYNHTYASEDSWFNLTVPNYYYRQELRRMGDIDSDNELSVSDSLSILRRSVDLESYSTAQEAKADVDGDGEISSSDALHVLRTTVDLEKPVIDVVKWSNGSGCGNDTASERGMYKKFMAESITYWAEEYHLDGFRFDLMGLHDTDTMNYIRDELDKIDSKIITYGEGWTMTSTTDSTNWKGNKTTLCTQGKAFRANDRIGFFNDTARDAIKGKAFDDLTSRGFVSGASGKANFLYQAMQGQINAVNWKAKTPTQNVMYSCCHDNQTLWDRLVASTYGSDADSSVFEKRREEFVAGNKLSGAIVLTSQGIPFMLAGEEFARTKLGDHNSYKSAADLNMIHWAEVEEYADTVSYYKGLLQLRENFDAFSDGTTATSEKMVKLETPSTVIGYTIENLSTAKNQWDSAVLFFNSSLTDAEEVTLPTNDEYVVVANDQTAGLSAIETVSGGKATVKPLSALILVPKASYDKANLSDNADAFVVVKHVDNATGEILKQTTIKGSEGQKYTTQSASDLLIKYDLDSVDGETSGKMAKGTTEITYKYNLYTGGFSTTVVKYVDQDGKVLYESNLGGEKRNGTEYTTNPRTFSWYDLVETPANASGVYKDGGIEVVYKYQYNKPASSEELMDTTVHIKIENADYNPNFYFWSDNGKDLPDAKGWPGITLTEKDANGWYSISFKTYYVYNWIINQDGGKQTADMAAAGDVWIVVNGTGLDNSENITIYNENPEA